MSGEMLASSLHKLNNSVNTYNKTVLCPRPEFGPRRLKKFGIPFYNEKQIYSILCICRIILPNINTIKS